MFSRYLSRLAQAAIVSLATATIPAVAHANASNIEALQQSSDGKIVALMHLVNTMEVRWAKLVVERSENSEVKAYATTLAAEHRAAQVELTKLAAQLQLNPDALLAQDAELQQERAAIDKAILALGTLQGVDFDKRFLELSVRGHSRLVERLGELSPSIQDASISSFITSLIPVEAKHRDEAQRLLDQLSR